MNQENTPVLLLDQIPLSMGAAVWGFILFVMCVFVIYSLLLLYHWLRFGEKAPAIFVTMILYFGVSLLLVITLISSATIVAL
jgi:hypothetical protein